MSDEETRGQLDALVMYLETQVERYAYLLTLVEGVRRDYIGGEE